MDVVRDVLDKSVSIETDARWAESMALCSKASRTSPLRLAAIVIGPAALGDRLHPALGRLVRRVEKWLGLDQNRPARVEFGDIDDVEGRVRLRLPIGDTAVAAIEQRLRGWVLRLPGAQ